MKRGYAFLMVIALLLVGCSTGAPAGGEVTLTSLPVISPIPTGLPTAISTLVPQSTTEAYPAPAPTQAGSSTEAYPAAQGVAEPNLATPSSAAAVSATNIATSMAAGSASAAPFKDCARTPGLAGCGNQSAAKIPALKARMAFFDSTANRLVGLDLETGAGWQAPLPAGEAPEWFDWSPPGTKEAQLLVSLGNNQYELFSAAGRLLESFTGEQAPAWQPGGVLSRDGAVRSAAGDEARLEHTQDMRWILHVKTAQGEHRDLPLAANPGDILYILRGWAPGMQALLGQSYFADNQAMIQGGQLITIDPTSGAIQTSKARMSLREGPNTAFAWDPLQPGRLALLETSESGVLAPGLALLDVKTGQIGLPLPEGVVVDGLAWTGDGKLTFAVERVPEPPSPDASKQIPGPGIYQLDPQAGKVQIVEPTPQGATDAWPHWSADGRMLVYARAIPAQGGGSSVQVRARRVSDGTEWVLVEGLAGPQEVVGSEFAQKLFAFTNK